MRLRLLLILVLLCVVPLAALFFGVTGRDDSYITFWPARCLAESGAICNYNGDHVEQSSTLLLTVAIALVTKLTTLPLPTVGWILSLVFGVLTVELTRRVARHMDVRLELAATSVAALALPIVYWSLSGTEVTVHCAFLLLEVLAIRRYLLHPSAGRLAAVAAASAGLLTVRPETPFVVVLAVLALFVATFFGARRADGATARRRLLAVAAVHAAILGLLLAFRQVYFGKLFPEPVYVKKRPIGVAVVTEGMSYLWDHTWASPWLILFIVTCVAAASLALSRRAVSSPVREPGGLLEEQLAAFFLATLGFVVFSGGDWMEFGRFIAALIPLAAVLAGAWLVNRLGARAWAALWIAVALVNSYSLVEAYRSKKNFGVGILEHNPAVDVWDRRYPITRWDEAPWYDRHHRARGGDWITWQWLEPAVQRLIELNPGQRIQVVSGSTGGIFYHLARRFGARLSFVDLCGLSTRDLLTCEVTRDVPRSKNGMCIAPELYPTMMADLEQKCHVRRPLIYADYLFGHVEETEQNLAAAGYTIVHRRILFKTGPLVIPYIVAVPTEWADKLDNTDPPSVSSRSRTP